MNPRTLKPSLLLLCALLCAGCDRKTAQGEDAGRVLVTSLSDHAQPALPFRYVTVLGLRTTTTTSSGAVVYSGGKGGGVGVPVGGGSRVNYLLRTADADLSVDRDDYVLLSRFFYRQQERGAVKLFGQGDGFDLVQPEAGVTLCLRDDLYRKLAPCPPVLAVRVQAVTVRRDAVDASTLETATRTYRVPNRQARAVAGALLTRGAVRPPTLTPAGGQRHQVTAPEGVPACLVRHPQRPGVFALPPVSCAQAQAASGQQP